jgi:hypothetical protein
VSRHIDDAATLTAGKNPWYLLNSRVDRPQGQSGHFGMDKYLLSLPEIQTRFLNLVAILSELPWLVYIYIYFFFNIIIYI